MPDLRLKLSAAHGHAKAVRASLRDWGTSNGLDDERIDDLLLVASELFSNAVKASATAEDDIALHASQRGHGVTLAVTNTGPPFDPDGIALAPPDARGGRGIAIARTIGTLDVRRRGGRTRVEVRIR